LIKTSYFDNLKLYIAERAALLGGVKVRLLPTDEDYSLRGETVADAIKEDKAKVLKLERSI